MDNLQALLDELLDVQFIDNTGADANVARFEVTDIVKRAHAAGAAAEKARIVAVIEALLADCKKTAADYRQNGRALVAGVYDGKADVVGAVLRHVAVQS